MPQKVILPGLKPYEQPVVSGAPARVIHPPVTRGLYMIVGIIAGLTSGIQIGLVSAASSYIQGELNLTPVELQWFTVAYLMTLVWVSPLLLKWRENYGIMPYVRAVVVFALLTNFVQIYFDGFYTQLLGRCMSGFMAGGLIAVAVYYCMQGVPNKLTAAGVIIGASTLQIANPLGRYLGSLLLAHNGLVENLQFLQLGMTLLTTAAVFYLPVTPTFKKPTFAWMDIPTYGMFIIGTASLLAFFGMGVIVWWDTPWLGIALLLGIGCLTISFVLEGSRSRPTIFPHYLFSGQMMRFFGLSFMMRLVLSEQLVGNTALLSFLGYGTQQLITYYGVLTLGAVLGLLAALATLKPPDVRMQTIFAFAIVAIASFMDVGVGSNSLPHHFYLTQGAISFAMLYFYGPLFMEGIARALNQGTAYIITHVVVFSVSQASAVMAGVALYGTFLIYRVKTHLINMGAENTISDPVIMAQLRELAVAQPGTIFNMASRTEQAVSMTANQVISEAVFTSFNEMFFASGCLATFVLLTYGLQWLILKLQGRTVMDEIIPGALSQVVMKDDD